MGIRDSRLAIAVIAALPALVHAQANPAARARHDAEAFGGGHWNGAHLEQRSQCTTPQNNGFHGTYSDYLFRIDTSQRTITLDEIAVTGLTCNYFGAYQDDGRLTWRGNMSCSDNRTGSFDAHTLFVHGNVFQVRMRIQLNSSERCSIDAIVSGARF
jgi:hypothetical protein